MEITSGDEITVASSVKMNGPFVNRKSRHGFVHFVTHEWVPSLFVPSKLRRNFTVGQASPKQLYLTFDDGPGPNTLPLSRMLKERNMAATFFLLGDQLEGQVEVASQLELDGHSVGTHGRSHSDPWQTSRKETIENVRTGASQLGKVVLSPTRWIRPPYGHITPWALRTSRKAGLTTVLWDVDPKDYHEASTAESVKDHVISRAKPHSVVLLHENGVSWKNFSDTMPRFLDALRLAGFCSIALPK